MALAEDEAAVIDVGGGYVTIDPDGYTVGSGEKVSHTGSYVLTGTGSSKVYFNKGTQDTYAFEVTLRNMKITAAQYCSALTIDAGVTLNLKVEGDNLSKGDNHPGNTMTTASKGMCFIVTFAGMRAILCPIRWEIGYGIARKSMCVCAASADATNTRRMHGMRVRR